LGFLALVTFPHPPPFVHYLAGGLERQTFVGGEGSGSRPGANLR
jgi:hypothetical protein